MRESVSRDMHETGMSISANFTETWYDLADQSEELVEFFGDPVLDMDSGSLFRFRHHCRIGILDLLAFLVQSPADFHDTRRND